MRKLLMMAALCAFLMAMCHIPSMYGDPPAVCPNERVNSDPKHAKCPVTAGFDITNIDDTGNQIIFHQCSDKSYSAFPPKDVVPICKAYKPLTHVSADRSKRVTSGGVNSYVDLDVNPLLPAGIVYVECFRYYTCKSDGTNGICELDQELTEVQVNYSTYSCVPIILDP